MSIAQELLNSETFLREAYSKLEEKGAIMPEKKNLANLASTIENISNVNFIEYVEATGTQYIDTGINLTSSHNLVFDGYAGTGGGAICGVIATNGDYRLHHLGDNKYRYVRRKSENVSDGYVFSSATYAFGFRHVLRTDANNLYVDGTLAGTATLYELNCDIPLYLFAVNKYNTVISEGTIRLYSFKIYDNSTLVRDYVPALDSENVPCLYDKVSQTYFYNQGTGEFLYG